MSTFTIFRGQRRMTELHRMYRENDSRGHREAMLKDIRATQENARRLRAKTGI
jgi:hypothetical protein